jgi:hypothetical protein
LTPGMTISTDNSVVVRDKDRLFNGRHVDRRVYLTVVGSF